MNLQSDDFELFGLPERFEQDAADIEARWKALHRQAHPDQFASHGSSAQRLAMQYAVRINEAHARLRDPMKRAAYLCALRGHAVDGPQATALDPNFLNQQMFWREALEDARGLESLKSLESDVLAAHHKALQACAHALDHVSDTAQAAGYVRQLMFIDRLKHDLSDRIDAMVHPA